MSPADGASLIYTSQNTPSQLPLLIHSTLGITSLLKRQPLKHNVIDRDKIVVAPNWDSWGKIRILGGTFDAELVSKGWEEDIKLPPGSNPGAAEDVAPTDEDADAPPTTPVHHSPSAITQYEEWCRDPNSGGLAVVESAMNDGKTVGVNSENPQDFFERQLKILEAFKAKAPEKGSANGDHLSSSRRVDFPEEKSVNDHIGPVQFNMGGIQVDADDMLQRLKVKSIAPFFSTSHHSKRTYFTAHQEKKGEKRSLEFHHIFTNTLSQDRNAHVSSPDEDYQLDDEDAGPPSNMATTNFDNEQLQSFFSNLMNRTAGAADSPRS